MNTARWAILITMMICFLTLTVSVSGVVYVNKNAIGANNGNSWEDAYVLLQMKMDKRPSRDR